MRLKIGRMLLCVVLGLAGGARGARAGGFSVTDSVGPTATLGALNADAHVDVTGNYSAGFSLGAGTMVATLTPEISFDGVTWSAAKFIDVAGTQTSTLVLTDPNSATNLQVVTIGGTRKVRVRVSSYTSGSASAFLVATLTQIQAGSGGGGGGGSVTQGTTPWITDGSGVVQPISAAALPLPSGAATQTTLAAISAQLPSALGTKTIATSVGVNIASDQTVPMNQTQVAGATVSTGNGTAGTGTQRVTVASDNTAIPVKPSDGTNTITVKAASTAAVATDTAQVVTLSPNQPQLTTPLNVTTTSNTTGANSQVASSATSVTCLAANSNRAAMALFNASTQIVYLKPGATASTTSYSVQVPAGGYWEMPQNWRYTGKFDCIWASANGFAYVTEITP